MAECVAQLIDPTTGDAQVGGKYLTFRLAKESYGLEILKVSELIKIMDITHVPQMPNFVKGVINLRGRVIPVIDLRLKFGLEELPYTEETCIIVVNLGSQIGIIVDTVEEVTDIDEHDIEPPPHMGYGVGTEFIRGMGKVDERVKILLDIEKVLTSEEIVSIEQIDVPADEDEGSNIKD